MTQLSDRSDLSYLAARVVAVLFAVFTLLGGAVDPTRDLHAEPKTSKTPVLTSLRVTLIVGEHSKDSHQRRYVATVGGVALTYTGPHGRCERGRCGEQRVELTLGGEERSRVVKLLETGKLLSAFREQRKTSAIGTYVELSLEVSLGHRRAVIAIRGMVREWSNASGKLTISPEARRRVSEVRRLVRIFTELAKKKDADFH